MPSDVKSDEEALALDFDRCEDFKEMFEDDTDVLIWVGEGKADITIRLEFLSAIETFTETSWIIPIGSSLFSGSSLLK